MAHDGHVRAILFDIDGTLISTGGAGAVSWRMAFEDLYGVPADIGRFSDAGMTDQEVARRTFAAVVGHEPDARELATLMAKRLEHLPQAVAESPGYHVLAGVAQLLPRLSSQGYLLGLTTGGVEAAAHIKLQRGGLNQFFSFGGYGSDSSDRGELTRTAVKRAEAIATRPLAREQVLVIGDTPLDIEAAHEANVTGVGVASGHFTVRQLRDAGGDYVLASLEQPLPL